MEQHLDSIDVDELAEGWDVECKLAAGRDGRGDLPVSFFETYSAMANSDGGVVLLGVREESPGKFQINGIVEIHRVQQLLWNGLNDPGRVSVNVLRREDVQVVMIGAATILKVRIPRASRTERPVYLGSNPLTGTYRRNFEGDYRCTARVVERMLADRTDSAHDARLIPGFDEGDFEPTTLRAYRNLFRSSRPDHEWGSTDDREFLRLIGAWNRDRDSNREGPTLGGLLMFGKLRSILDAVPNYVVDFQERSAPDDLDIRWDDRITTDGTWTGNVFDFYRLVIQRLTANLKIPFRLDGTTRIDDTPIHVVLREALVNTLIHADYSDRISILVIRRPDGFSFRNPGALRLPVQDILRGGQSDCRNRNMQKMFQLAGMGEQLGTGVPRIYRNWTEQHWTHPNLRDSVDPDKTELELRMLSVVQEVVWQELFERFGDRVSALNETQRLALVTVVAEGSVTNARLQQISSRHPSDLTRDLRYLVQQGMLVSDGFTRATIYRFPDPDPNVASITITGASSTHNGSNSTHSESRSPHSDLVRGQRRVNPVVMRAAILEVTAQSFVSLEEISRTLDRSARTIRDHYLRPMIAEGVLIAQFPSQPKHPKQAYRAMVSQEINPRERL